MVGFVSWILRQLPDTVVSNSGRTDGRTNWRTDRQTDEDRRTDEQTDDQCHRSSKLFKLKTCTFNFSSFKLSSFQITQIPLQTFKRSFLNWICRYYRLFDTVPSCVPSEVKRQESDVSSASESIICLSVIDMIRLCFNLFSVCAFSLGLGFLKFASAAFLLRWPLRPNGREPSQPVGKGLRIFRSRCVFIVHGFYNCFSN